MVRVSNSGAGVRTPHSARAADGSSKCQRPNTKTSIYGSKNLSLAHCHLPLPPGARAPPPRLHRKIVYPDWLSRACDGAVRDCDALPQRNCGRFARPSLLTRMKRTSGAQVTRGKGQVPRISHIVLAI